MSTEQNGKMSYEETMELIHKGGLTTEEFKKILRLQFIACIIPIKDVDIDTESENFMQMMNMIKDGFSVVLQHMDLEEGVTYFVLGRV